MPPPWPALPRVELLAGPTPLLPAPALSAALGGPRLWVKRDDLTPVALGGNKLRKLEYLIAAALAEGADVVVTAGAVQSNHCVQTAAACNRHGLACVVVLSGVRDQPVMGNLLLNYLLGAEVRLRDMTMDERNEAALECAAELTRSGRRPYVVPVGGSNALGVIGYARAAFEIAEQAAANVIRPAAVVCASGSGGTQAGLVLGAAAMGFPFEVHGISVRGDATTLAERVAELASAGGELVGEAPVVANDVKVHDSYVGPGYAQLTPEVIEAMSIAATTEGLLLDPVYTGKAMSGLIGEIAAGRWSEGDDVIFVHTGGAAALFAYNERLLARPTVSV